MAPKPVVRAISTARPPPASRAARSSSFSSSSVFAENFWPLASDRSAPRSACACSRTEACRLSVKELMATRALTPTATASTSRKSRRREARLSRQAMARTKRAPLTIGSG